MGERGDGTPPCRQVANGQIANGLAATGPAANGQPSQLTLEELLRVDGAGSDSGREPDRDEAGAAEPEVGELKPVAERRPVAEHRPEPIPVSPPWPTVIATTMRLWFRRHIPPRFRRHMPRHGRLSRHRLSRHRLSRHRLSRHRWVTALVALAVASLAVGALTVSTTRHAVTTPAGRPQAPRTGPPGGPAGRNSGALPATQAAAAWVAQQLSRDAIVACDPSMCRVLVAQGIPVQNLLVLQSGSTDPLFSNVIVATRAVRGLFGSRLQFVDAPIVIASFGAGAARIDVRAVAPDGAAAYQAAFSSDWAARRASAAELVRNPGIHAAGAARQELRTGLVDSRLLITLAAVAVSHSVNVVAFGGSAPAASAGVPLREMEISAAGSSAYRSAELQRIRSFVLAQRPAFLPAHVGLVRAANGGMVLRIEFGAPSPLGLLLGSPVTQ